MPKTQKTRKKKPKKKEPEIILHRLPGEGNIDPRLIRKAVEEVIAERRKREAEERANARSSRNGKSQVADTE